MKIVFVGHFSSLSSSVSPATSNATNQVQRRILEVLAQKAGQEETRCYVMTPQAFWPRGPLFVRSVTEGGAEFLSYLNLPVAKHFVFGLMLLAKLIAFKPRLCVQYNSYLFENLALLLYRWFNTACRVAIIIQDVFIFKEESVFSKRGLTSLSQRLALRLVRRVDAIIPVSDQIVVDFDLPSEKCHIFQGGITDFAAELMLSDDVVMGDYAVFAGALEPYNGIERLLEIWPAMVEIDAVLHVFGSGSLAELAQEAARDSEKIVFHGFQQELVVLGWQRTARWNFCLRYSEGINATYFFPSKLFNILCAQGVAVVNRFPGLPEDLEGYTCVVKDDLSNLEEQLVLARAIANAEHVLARRRIVNTSYRWESCIARLLKKSY